MKRLAPTIITLAIVAISGLTGLPFGVNYIYSCIISFVAIVLLTSINAGIVFLTKTLEKKLKEHGK